MSFRNPSVTAIRELLRRSRTIAVIGLSDDPARPSHEVSLAMRGFGYRILPVNPGLTHWQGAPVYASLADVATALGPDQSIDIVNVFRRPAHVGAVVDECLRLGLPALWLQLGVVNEAAALRATAGGMTVVMDRCIYVDRAAMPD